MTASSEQMSPLVGWSERFARASVSSQTFSVRERPFTTQVNLRGDPSHPAFVAAVHDATGCELPAIAGTFEGTKDGMTIIWLGPDEWLVVDRPGRGDEITEMLRRALIGMRHSVVDVSAARTAIEIAGADARLVLAKGCPLDVHASALAPPCAVQSLLARTRVLIQCVATAPMFRLFVLDSFADYLAEWIVDAAAECAASRTADFDGIGSRLT